MSSTTVKVFKEKDWRQVVSTLEGAITQMFDMGSTSTEADTDTRDVTPTPPPSPHRPALPEPYFRHPAVDFGNGGFRGFAAPHFFDRQLPPNIYMAQGPVISQQPMYGHNGIVMHDMYKHPAGYIQTQYNNMPVLGFPARVDQKMNPVGLQNGNLMYQMPANMFAPPAPALSLNMCIPNYTQSLIRADENNPYIKKPLNAFMIFRKEQRPIVMAEQKIRDSASVNAIVGRKWKDLTREQQARYYDEAEKERVLHAQKYPNWSSKCNYGKSKMKNKKKNEMTLTDNKNPMGMCVNEPFTAVVLAPAPSQNPMMVMEHPNHLAVPTQSLYLRHLNSLP